MFKKSLTKYMIRAVFSILQYLDPIEKV